MSRSLTVKKIEGKPGQVYYPLKINDIPKPSPGPKQVLVKLSAASLNHRDLFIRQHLYPAISFTSPLFADGVGKIVEVGSDAAALGVGKRVVLMPCVGWSSDPAGPEAGTSFSVLGSSRLHPAGMGQDYIAFDADQVEAAPEHLSDAEAAALPLVGLTAWRALVTKSTGNADAGCNVLVTGIGGGVALQALQFAVARGCNVFVTSSSREKIDKAVNMGAKGGVLYSSALWEKELAKLLPESRPHVDLVVDGAGGDIVTRAVKVLKYGGVISQYGMTLGPKMDWSMAAVLKNIELRGTTMGSREEFREMVAFVREKRVTPVISRTVSGLGNLQGIDELFEDMKAGSQFGKLVVNFGGDDGDDAEKTGSDSKL